jgi:GNAT superfamily N-acetyltransferase
MNSGMNSEMTTGLDVPLLPATKAPAKLAVQVRAAEPADLARILQLQQAALEVLSQGSYSPSQIQALVVDQGDIRASNHKTSQEFLFVAEGGTEGATPEIVGFAALGFCCNVIYGLYVDPAWARRGVGSQLLAHMEAVTQARGRQRLKVMSSLTGVPFYASQGYQFVSKTGFWIADRVWIPCQSLEKCFVTVEENAPGVPISKVIGIIFLMICLGLGVGFWELQKQELQNPRETPPQNRMDE